MEKTIPTTFPAALKDFFGLKENQTLRDFMAEIKELSDDDKAQLRAALIEKGYQIK